MMQIGDLQPKPAFSNPLPAEGDKQQQPSRRLPEEQGAPVRVAAAGTLAACLSGAIAGPPD
jgi:hypothetical protein